MPSGWYHEVENLEPTLSINHNWTNGFGLLAMWAFLASELAAVQAALADCRESFAPGGWEAQCERVLRCNAAMCNPTSPSPNPNLNLTLTLTLALTLTLGV